MKIAVGLSGGVDSSVAAALLKEQGHEVIGITMKVWEEEGDPSVEYKAACIGPGEKDDLVNAEKVAKDLGIPFYVVDLMEEYKKTVLSYFTSEYKEGKTPNPCMHCNHKIKFKALIEKALESGIDFEYFATGHYAKVEFDKDSGRYLLKKAFYLKKDQSYFLARLDQDQLAKVLFPLSGYTKEQVREAAARFGLITKDKPESQDFYSGDYGDLFDEPPSEGDIVDMDGNVLGRHKGIIYYTIGKRRGLGIAHHVPLYVVDIDSINNRVIVGPEDKLYRDHLIARDMNWISIPRLKESREVQVKIRYNHVGSEAEISPREDGSVYVKFFQPIRAISPGQTAVFYDGDTVIGAGSIEAYRE